MENLKIILGETNRSFDDVIKCTVYLLVFFFWYSRIWAILPKSMKSMRNTLPKEITLQELQLLLHNYLKMQKFKFKL